ncbi:MAG: metallophosphoesterase (TIGR00282 family) [Alphaproteobacteria bacterium]
MLLNKIIKVSYEMTLKVLFLGDVAGKPGRAAVERHLPALRKSSGADFVVVNAENAATSNKGITSEIAKEIFKAGADVITMGDHTFDRKGTEDLLAINSKIIIPANYIMDTPGKGFRIYTLENGKKIGVMNLLGTVFMPGKVNCPFIYSKKFQKEYRLGTDYDALIVDFHAEATGEKCVMGHQWDGKASLVVGTHTHIPTCDARVQTRGTGYQSDAGMCGDYNSSLGLDLESTLQRQFDTRRSTWKHEASSGEGTICGTYVELDDNGLCLDIQSFQIGGCLAQKQIYTENSKSKRKAS